MAADALLDLVVQRALERLQALEVDIQTKVDLPPDANLVLTVAKLPHGPLSAALLDAGFQVHVIGDARQPGRTLTAFADAHGIDLELYSDL